MHNSHLTRIIWHFVCDHEAEENWIAPNLIAHGGLYNNFMLIPKKLWFLLLDIHDQFIFLSVGSLGKKHIMLKKTKAWTKVPLFSRDRISQTMEFKIQMSSKQL